MDQVVIMNKEKKKFADEPNFTEKKDIQTRRM